MMEAKRLLGSTKLSVGEIAARLGYDNTSNSSAFRLWSGANPSQWRAANHEHGDRAKTSLSAIQN